MMNQLLWVFFGISFSYLISYVADLQVYPACGIKIQKSFRKQLPALLCSFVCRFVCIITVSGFLLKIHSKFPIFDSTTGMSYMRIPVAMLASSITVTGAGAYFALIVRHLAKKHVYAGGDEWGPLLGGVLKVERLGWKSFVSELANELSDQICLLWRQHDGANTTWAIYTLFEERKEEIISHTLRNKYNYDPGLWLYYGLMVGNTNIKKLEAIMGTIGREKMISELDDLIQGRRESEYKITDDLREHPTELFRQFKCAKNNDDKTDLINIMINHERASYRHIGNIIIHDPKVLVAFVKNTEKRLTVNV